MALSIIPGPLAFADGNFALFNVPRKPEPPGDPFVPVVIARGIHPFPSRTRKLSLSAPMVLRG